MFDNIKDTWRALTAPLNLDEVANPNLKPQEEKPKEPEPVIGCIAKNILADMGLASIDTWETTEVKGDGGRRSYTLFKNKSKNYTLNFSVRCWGLITYYVNFEGLDTFSFTDDEQRAISNQYEEIEKFLTEQKHKNALKQDEEILKKIFPDCY